MRATVERHFTRGGKAYSAMRVEGGPAPGVYEVLRGPDQAARAKLAAQQEAARRARHAEEEAERERLRLEQVERDRAAWEAIEAKIAADPRFARLERLARADQERSHRAYEHVSATGTDRAEAPWYSARAKFWRAVANGVNAGDAFDVLKLEWESYAKENNAKVKEAPKIKGRMGSAGLSVIQHRHVDLHKAESERASLFKEVAAADALTPKPKKITGETLLWWPPAPDGIPLKPDAELELPNWPHPADVKPFPFFRPVDPEGNPYPFMRRGSPLDCKSGVYIIWIQPESSDEIDRFYVGSSVGVSRQGNVRRTAARHWQDWKRANGAPGGETVPRRQVLICFFVVPLDLEIPETALMRTSEGNVPDSRYGLPPSQIESWYQREMGHVFELLGRQMLVDFDSPDTPF